MMAHQAMVKDLQMIYQMNTEVFQPLKHAAHSTHGYVLQLPEIEVFQQSDTKTTVINCILHSADVSNPCKLWEVTEAWAHACLAEFFALGDQEKDRGIPVQFLNDREKLNKPNSQIGFFEFMIAPFFAAQIRLWPTLHELGENLGNNLSKWADMWEREAMPNDEEKQKVRTRVEKATDNI